MLWLRIDSSSWTWEGEKSQYAPPTFRRVRIAVSTGTLHFGSDPRTACTSGWLPAYCLRRKVEDFTVTSAKSLAAIKSAFGMRVAVQGVTKNTPRVLSASAPTTPAAVGHACCWETANSAASCRPRSAWNPGRGPRLAAPARRPFRT